MTTATQPAEVAKFVERIQKQIRARKVFPSGHTVGIAYAKVFGPRNATTPEGHPITICSGPFDNTVETAVSAIARRAKVMFGYEVNLDDWQLEMEEDVSIPPAHGWAGKVAYSKFYHFRYLPETHKWLSRGLHDGNVVNHFHSSWYLSHNHAKPDYVVDQSLGTTLVPAVTT
jgi:hypothetical protein